VRKTFAAVDRLARGGRIHQDIYKAVCLATGAGLRKSEISAARWGWFHEVDGQVVIRAAGFVTKNGSSLGTPMLRDWWVKLAAARPAGAGPEDRVLTGGTDKVFRRLSRLMRSLGWKTQKAAHEFRALVGCRVAEACGIESASLFLRHGAISTTQRFYGRYLKLRDLSAVKV
jgi:integrase